MKILLVHNRYQQAGGEDLVYEAERDLLERHGHEVHSYEVSNDEIAHYTAAQRLRLVDRTIWSRKSYKALEQIVVQEKPVVVHFHNTLPLISPSGYYAVHRHGSAVVQTLHNFRLTCLNGLLLRDGHLCEACVGKAFPWPGIKHACYRGSRSASTTVAMMLASHRLFGTYTHAVDRYIAPSASTSKKYVQAGLPVDKIDVKPHFLPNDPGEGEGAGNYALFVGRLSPEKGLSLLLEAWSKIGERLPLKIVGDGPLAEAVSKTAHQHPGIESLGLQSHQDVLHLMQAASLLLAPSVAYETFGMTVIEAFACGLPVVASRLGSRAELVTDKQTGLHFEPHNAADLTAKIQWWLDHPEAHTAMRRAARTAFETRFSAEQNYQQLMQIYEAAIRTSTDKRT